MSERKTNRTRKQFVIRGCLNTVVFGPFWYNTETNNIDSRFVSDIKRILRSVKNGKKIPLSWKYTASIPSVSEVIWGMNRRIYHVEKYDAQTIQENHPD
jgi:hypothetical protein